MFVVLLYNRTLAVCVCFDTQLWSVGALSFKFWSSVVVVDVVDVVEIIVVCDTIIGPLILCSPPSSEDVCTRRVHSNTDQLEASSSRS